MSLRRRYIIKLLAKQLVLLYNIFINLREALIMNLKEHLLSRGFDSNKYVCWLNEPVMTLPLWDFSGKLVGYQTYNPSAPKVQGTDPLEVKYYTYSTKQTVWGLETLTREEARVFLTESVFKAVALHNFGLPALSVCGSKVSKPLMQELELQNFLLVPVGDNDKAGEEFSRSFSHEGLVSPRDLDEMSTEELSHMFSKFL